MTEPIVGVEVALLCTCPPIPMYAAPWERLERLRVEVKVEEALDIKPFVKPTIVEVETPYEVLVNGNTPPPVPVIVTFDVVVDIVTVPAPVKETGRY